MTCDLTRAKQEAAVRSSRILKKEQLFEGMPRYVSYLRLVIDGQDNFCNPHIFQGLDLVTKGLQKKLIRRFAEQLYKDLNLPRTGKWSIIGYSILNPSLFVSIVTII
jgi:hypothetical protein